MSANNVRLFRRLLTGASVAALGHMGVSAVAQTVDGGPGGRHAVIEQIVVTAQKREDSIQSVGMSVSALTSTDLRARGIDSPADLVKVVPGFNFTESSYGVPVYTLRGIGFYDTSLAGSPTVSVYVDEVPLPFSIMTVGAGLDLERVEVLKGPQGTLFGQNSTGGAINYIAAKPTDSFEAGADFTFARFDEIDLTGFVSGPISETVAARASFRINRRNEWQKSYTRDDEIGDKDLMMGRLLIDWTPGDRTLVRLNVNGWRDQSDNQVGQFAGLIGNPNKPQVILDTPLPPNGIRYADWNPGVDYSRDDDFFQISARIEHTFSGGPTLTSISAYQELNRYSWTDADGTQYPNFTVFQEGRIESLSQEIRIDDTIGDNFSWIIGGNYGRDTIHDETSPFTATGFATFPFSAARSIGDSKVETMAVFGSADWTFAPNLTLQAGLRYTDTKRDYQGCTYDGGAGDLSAVFGGIASSRRGETITIAPGACASLNEEFLPAQFIDTLSEDNISWRVGLNWQVAENSLLYANVSQGYKAGGFPVAGATYHFSLGAVTEEKVLAYETGFKLSLADQRIQLNGAVFYYDYSDKQIRGRIPDPTLGRQNRLFNIPDSRVIGGELEATVIPLTGLRLTGGLTYVDSKIKGSFIASDALGVEKDLGGEPFPLMPEWQAQLDAEYDFAFTSNLNMFLGGHLNHQGSTNAGLGELPILDIKSYTVIDARAGLRDAEDQWNLTLFVRNLTGEKYWNFASFASPDTAIRFIGMPRTWGMTLSVRY